MCTCGCSTKLKPLVAVQEQTRQTLVQRKFGVGSFLPLAVLILSAVWFYSYFIFAVSSENWKFIMFLWLIPFYFINGVNGVVAASYENKHYLADFWRDISFSFAIAALLILFVLLVVWPIINFASFAIVMALICSGAFVLATLSIAVGKMGETLLRTVI
ncbi:MAG: hypothetical protein FWG63_08135 [Defluviitaleaceae bacterium]|nr:hypothetical protein [Defluviitaleaceae bacterium]